LNHLFLYQNSPLTGIEPDFSNRKGIEPCKQVYGQLTCCRWDMRLPFPPRFIKTGRAHHSAGYQKKIFVITCYLPVADRLWVVHAVMIKNHAKAISLRSLLITRAFDRDFPDFSRNQIHSTVSRKRKVIFPGSIATGKKNGRTKHMIRTMNHLLGETKRCRQSLSTAAYQRCISHQ